MSGRNRKDVDDLLADLDNLGSEKPIKSLRKGVEPKKAGTDDAQSLLDDLDTLVSTRATSNSRASLRQKETASPAPSGLSSAPVVASDAETTRPSMDAVASPVTTVIPATSSSETAPTATASWSGWGSSIFSQATKLADQARQELEKRATSEQAKELQSKGWDLAKNVRGLVKETGLEKWGEEVTKVGKRGWTDMVNAVAPPIAAHEIIQVTLSHDMVGYDGISDVTYQVLAKVMEQVHQSSGTEQQLVVNKAPVEIPAATPKASGDDQERDLNQVYGFAAAFRLAKANLDECIKKHQVAAPPAKTASAAAAAASLPITTCPVFVRIQACFAPLPGVAEEGAEATEHKEAQSLFFLIMLRDPQHGLSHKTISQAVPTSWLDVPFESNEWVEESLVDVLSNALSVIGQDYVQGRMSGRTKSSKDGLVNDGVAEAE